MPVGLERGDGTMEFGAPEAMQRAASALKLLLGYSEEGLHFPRPRLKKKAGLLDGVSQSQSSSGGIILGETLSSWFSSWSVCLTLTSLVEYNLYPEVSSV